ncbi:hypothetical protein [Phenylobacterium sp.]|uniref:hypothetical protein n=1 Tax=Phenylobacterium sp. TaxID=1871053 RepID=UPI0035B3F75B
MACAGAGALLSGCVGDVFSDAKVDPASPVAGEVAKLTRADGDYPSFREIPAPPKDVRPKRLYGQAADEIEQSRAALERDTAPSSWTLQNTDTFAAGARRAAGPDDAPAPARGTEAFAEELRQRATPPPPPKN